MWPFCDISIMWLVILLAMWPTCVIPLVVLLVTGAGDRNTWPLWSAFWLDRPILSKCCVLAPSSETLGRLLAAETGVVRNDGGRGVSDCTCSLGILLLLPPSLLLLTLLFLPCSPMPLTVCAPCWEPLPLDWPQLGFIVLKRKRRILKLDLRTANVSCLSVPRNGSQTILSNSLASPCL